MKTLLFLALLVVTAAKASGLVTPFLPHVHGRTPDVAWRTLPPRLQSLVVERIAYHQGMPSALVRRNFEQKLWEMCTVRGRFLSDGLVHYHSGMQVDRIDRLAYRDERFACRKGVPVFSGTCANPVYTMTSPQKGYVCREAGWQSQSVDLFDHTLGIVAGGLWLEAPVHLETLQAFSVLLECAEEEE